MAHRRTLAGIPAALACSVALVAAPGVAAAPVAPQVAVADGMLKLCVKKINDPKYTTSYGIDVFRGTEKVAITFFASGKNGKPGCASKVFTLPEGAYTAVLEKYSFAVTPKYTVKQPGAKKKTKLIKGKKQAADVTAKFTIGTGTTTVTFFSKLLRPAS